MSDLEKALQVARGYAADPEMWNPPTPEQMALILNELARLAK